jgi:hypothetical protein
MTRRPNVDPRPPPSAHYDTSDILCWNRREQVLLTTWKAPGLLSGSLNRAKPLCSNGRE